jgi:WD40 repeat protein
MGHTDLGTSVAFAPLENVLASSSIDGTVRLWNVRSHEPVAVLHHGNQCYAVAFGLPRFTPTTETIERRFSTNRRHLEGIQ